jgi:hypothetical protein
LYYQIRKESEIQGKWKRKLTELESSKTITQEKIGNVVTPMGCGIFLFI